MFCEVLMDLSSCGYGQGARNEKRSEISVSDADKKLVKWENINSATLCDLKLLFNDLKSQEEQLSSKIKHLSSKIRTRQGLEKAMASGIFAEDCVEVVGRELMLKSQDYYWNRPLYKEKDGEPFYKCGYWEYGFLVQDKVYRCLKEKTALNIETIIDDVLGNLEEITYGPIDDDDEFSVPTRTSSPVPWDCDDDENEVVKLNNYTLTVVPRCMVHKSKEWYEMIMSFIKEYNESIDAIKNCELKIPKY